MDHAITVGNVVMVGGIALTVITVCGCALLVLSILNPFRSGH